MTELQCDVSALVWLLLNWAVIGLDDADIDRVTREVKEISRRRFEAEGKPFDAPFFDRGELEKLALLADPSRTAHASPT